MNRQIANYLFTNEILYSTKEINLEKVAPIIESNEKNTIQFDKELFILSYQMKDEEKVFLEKILSSIGFNLETISLLEIKKNNAFDKEIITYQEFINQEKTKTLISFDVALAKLNWNQTLPINETKTFGNVNFLLTESLSKIENNINSKKALWANLQKLFPKKH